MLLLNDTKLLSERVPENVQINFGIKWYKVVSEKNKTDAVIIKKKQNGWSPDKHCDRMIQSRYRKEASLPLENTSWPLADHAFQQLNSLFISSSVD